MRRAVAPIAHAHRHGGTKEKGRKGFVPEKESFTACGGCILSALTPGYRTVGLAFVSDGSEVQILLGGSFQALLT
jgi:hypothetical protein